MQNTGVAPADVFAGPRSPPVQSKRESVEPVAFGMLQCRGQTVIFQHRMQLFADPAQRLAGIQFAILAAVVARLYQSERHPAQRFFERSRPADRVVFAGKQLPNPLSRFFRRHVPEHSRFVIPLVERFKNLENQVTHWLLYLPACFVVALVSPRVALRATRAAVVVCESRKHAPRAPPWRWFRGRLWLARAPPRGLP